ncbi:MAG: cytidine deaminase [Candidatus Acidiferrales bacterium]
MNDPVENELIEAAKDIIRRRYRPDWHVVGAAVRMTSGRIYTGVHLEANVGRAAVCAEAIALGKAVCEGDEEIDTIVAVYHPRSGSADQEIRVVTPCGICREMIADYGPKAKVIVPGGGNEVNTVPISELLPARYQHPPG